MEVTGLTISVAGLAALFDLCLKGFDLLEQGKDFSRDHTILMARHRSTSNLHYLGRRGRTFGEQRS